jgi:hypothetical protein
MKYFVKYLLLIATTCLIHQTLHAQRRNVVFFYGLNKKATESQAYANAFETSRSITSVFETFNYATQQTDPQGMVKVAEDARIQATTALTALSATAVSDPRNVALGHDVGGLIARQINKTHSMFGGIILTGTPNTEMPLVSNYMNGRLFLDFKHIGLQRAGDVKASFKLGAQDFGMIPIAEIPMKWAEKTFGADPAAIFRSVNDLQKDSRFLRNLGNPTVPTVAIWGNENDPAIWHFFSSVNSAAIGATPLATTDRSDASLVTLVNAAADAANATLNSENRWGIFKVIGAVAGIALAIAALPAATTGVLEAVGKLVIGTSAGGLGIFGAIGNFENAAKARSTRDWLEIDCRTIWNNLIGATRDEIVTVDNRGAMTESCRQGINDPARGWGWYHTQLTQEERDRCWIGEITQFLAHVQEESDGVLHKTTQQFGLTLPPRARIEARGANHEELLNHTGATAAYRQIWSGESESFFRTL